MTYTNHPLLITGTPVAISIYTTSQEQPHYHEGFLEIIYCLKGSAKIHISYEEIQLEEGDIISCDHHDIHALHSSEDNLFVSFYFDLADPVFKNPDLQHFFFVCERYVLRKEKQEQLQNLKHYLLTLLYFYCFPDSKVSQEETFCYLAGKIIDIMVEHFHFFDYAVNALDYSDEAKKRFERIMVYTDQHYQEKLTIEKISKKEHLNANYLSQSFKKTTFLRYSSFLHFLRVYYSELLLLNTDKTISEISYEVGFSDPKFYYRFFKIWYGHTPLAHKKYLREIARKASENRYYSVSEIPATLEHYIALYFATLHVPEYWNVPYVPYRNIPFEKK